MPIFARARRRDGGGSRDDADAMQRALLAVLDGDLAAAEQLLGAAVREDSSEVGRYLVLARLYRERGAIGRAIHLHQNLLLRRDTDGPARFDALLGLAEDFRAGGFLRRAVAAYEEVLSEAPAHAGALRALVGLLVAAREPARAVPLARRLARIEGRPPGASEAALLVEVAETERASGRSESARRSLRRAVRRDPACVRAWIALGEVEGELGHARRALEAWRRVPALDRRAGSRVYAHLAATCAALGRGADHERYLCELLETEPGDACARLALAQAMAARGAADEAAAELRGLLEREPDHVEAHRALGRLLLAEQRLEEVAKAHASLLELLDRRPPFGGELGEAFA